MCVASIPPAPSWPKVDVQPASRTSLGAPMYATDEGASRLSCSRSCEDHASLIFLFGVVHDVHARRGPCPGLVAFAWRSTRSRPLVRSEMSGGEERPSAPADRHTTKRAVQAACLARGT